MSEFNVEVESGKSVKLLTAGKYCDRDVVVTATGGGDSHYDTFWDTYQQNGKRTNYDRAFAGVGWYDEIFQPKYPIRPASASCTMYMSFGATCITRVDKTLLDLTSGVVKELTYTFYTANYSVPSLLYCEIDVRYITKYTSTFQSNNKIHTIILENVNPNAVFDNNCFNGCSALQNLTTTGTINSAINLSWSSLLTADSVDSVIAALADRTGQSSLKVSFHSTVLANLTEAQANAINAKNWTF